MIANLREWWNELCCLGPSFGYYPNPSKTWLVTKSDCVSTAAKAFDGTNVDYISALPLVPMINMSQKRFSNGLLN